MKSFAGRIYRNGKFTPGILHVDDDGNIAKIARTDTAEDHTDFGDRCIVPGAIDVHVHFRDPGASHKEDIQTGSASAAFGGVTGFVDMPNTLPATTTIKACQDKLATMDAKSHVDYGIWGGATWYTGEVEAMLEMAVGMKIYLGATTGDLLLEDNGAFKEVLSHCGKHGKPVILHCEAERILRQYRRNEVVLADHDLSRPPLAEVEAIYDVMKTLPGIKTPPVIHIAHIASPDAVQAATAAKFSKGVCPHHMLLTHEGWQMAPGYGKMNPPLRTDAVRQRLLDVFMAGEIPILESDHAPHTKGEKDDAFSNAPAGVPGVETLVPAMLAAVGEEGRTRVLDSVTKAPAALLGLTDRGELEKGKRADFAVYDFDDVQIIDGSKLHSRCGWSPYDGMPAIFPTDTYLAGEPVVADRKLVGAPGLGKRLGA